MDCLYGGDYGFDRASFNRGCIFVEGVERNSRYICSIGESDGCFIDIIRIFGIEFHESG